MDKNIIKIPFRPQHLLSMSSFVSYCRDNGISVSEKTLEKLHKNGLLYPAVKVYRGTVTIKKIYTNFQEEKRGKFIDSKDEKKFKPIKTDKKKWYISGGFHIGQKDWLDWYIKKKMVEYPIFQKFTSWDKRTSEYYTDKKTDVENCYEMFYEKLQLIALKIVIEKMRIWKILDESQKKQNKKWIKKELAKLYNFLKFYIEMEDLYAESINLKKKCVENCYKKYNISSDKKKRQERFKKDFKDFCKPKLKTEAQSLLKKYKLKLDHIKDWRYLIVQQNIFYETPRSSSCIRNYLKGMDENFLIKAEDVNYMIYIINFFINLLTNENLTVKQIIGKLPVEYCPICGVAFNSEGKGRVTCGYPYCVNENKNKSKRQKRRLNNT